MAWIRCERGEHIYDNGKHSSCPFCRQVGSGAPPKDTVDDNVLTSDIDMRSPSGSPANAPAVPSATQGMEFGGGSGKTVGFFSEAETGKKPFDPVVGWLVVVSEVNRGEDFRLRAGYNMLGRTEKSDIFLDFDKKISRTEQATVIYDPKTSEFFVQHMKGHNVTYLNNSILLQPAQLKPYDVITVGDTELIFMPLCGKQFRWDEDLATRAAESKQNADAPSLLEESNDE